MTITQPAWNTPPEPRLSNFDQATRLTLMVLRKIDLEIERLEASKVAHRAELFAALSASDDAKAEFLDLGTATIMEGKTTVIVVDAALVPPRFVKTEPSIDVVGAGKALRAGGEISGLRLSEPGERSLRVVWAR